MKFTRGTRRRLAMGLAASGVLTSIILFVVVPAFATAPGAAIPPPSNPKNVMPVDVATGGQSNDCTLFGSTAQYQYRISNPKNGTYKTTPFQGGPQVTFTLTMNPPNTSPSLPAYANDKYVSFSSTGVGIVDVGIKGGTDEARYNYAGLFGSPSYGFVSSDGYLHAPAQSVDSQGNPTSLYSVSNLTFCYSLVGSISGKVYNDKNGSATQDQGESGLSGWTVNLRDNATSSLISTTTSGTDGSYSFSLPLSTSTTYRICETPPTGTGPWAQSVPSTTACSTGSELAKGYNNVTATSATQSITGEDFGNALGETCNGPFDPNGDGSYLVALANCKTNVFVFNTGTTSDGHHFVSYWVNDQTQAKEPLVEKIVWPYDETKGQNQFKVFYTDAFPIDPSKATEMQYCKLDPRDSSDAQGLTLLSTYQDDNNKGQVLPGTETSCLISTTESANGSFVAFVFSDVDSWRNN